MLKYKQFPFCFSTPSQHIPVASLCLLALMLVSCVSTGSVVILSGIRTSNKYDLDFYGTIIAHDIDYGTFFFVSSNDPIERVVRISNPINHPEQLSITYGEVMGRSHATGSTEWEPINNVASRQTLVDFLNLVLTNWKKKQYRRNQVLALRAMVLADSKTNSTLPNPSEADEWQNSYLDSIDMAKTVEGVVSPQSYAEGNIIVKLAGRDDDIVRLFFDINVKPIQFIIPSSNGQIDLVTQEPFYGMKMIQMLKDYLGTQRSNTIKPELRRQIEQLITLYAAKM